MEWPSWRRRAELIAARASNPNITKHQLSQALHEMPYPAQRWQLIIWADFNGSGWLVMPTLSELPDRQYNDFDEVCRAVVPESAVDTEHDLLEEWVR